MKDSFYRVFVILCMVVAVVTLLTYSIIEKIEKNNKKNRNDSLQFYKEEESYVDESENFTTYVDKETGVNYILYFRFGHVAICPRYNADGSLYITKNEINNLQ